MKKVLIILLGILTIILCTASSIYYINTSRGEQQVIIPDGYTDKDVLLEVSKNYYEQTWEYEEVLTQISNLNIKVNEYIEENQKLRNKYEELVSDYDLLAKKYQLSKGWSSFKGILGAELNMGTENIIKGASITIGTILFNKVIAYGEVSYPLELSIGFDFIF